MRSAGMQFCNNWTGCNCHALHLVFTTTFKVIPSCRAVWIKIDKICTHFGRGEACILLKKAGEKRNSKKKFLQHPLVIRWWTYVKSLQDILAFYEDIELITKDDSTLEQVKKELLFSPDEKQMAIGLYNVLAPMQKDLLPFRKWKKVSCR